MTTINKIKKIISDYASGISVYDLMSEVCDFLINDGYTVYIDGRDLVVDCVKYSFMRTPSGWAVRN